MTMSTLTHRGALGAALSICCVAAMGCGGMTDAVPKENADANAPIRVVIPVEVQQPEQGAISAYIDSRTRIEAEANIELASQGTGRCVQLLAEEGDVVKKGDILAQLDREEAEANYRQNQIQVQKQKNDYERAKEAFKAGLMPEADYESARFAYEQGQASLETQRVQLDQLTIKAPIGGIISDRMIQVGMLVTSGAPVFKIVDPDTFKIVINPVEKYLADLEMGQAAHVTVDALPGEEFVARVSRINPAVDALSGTIKVTLTFDKGQPVEKLLAAAYTRVKLVMSTHENAMLLPKDAIIEENGNDFVFVVKAGEADDTTETPDTVDGDAESLVAHRVQVDVGFEDANRVEILGGIDETDRVVIVGQHNLKDNANVRVTTAEAEISANIDLTPEQALEKSKTQELNGKSGRRRMRDRL